MRTEDLDPEQQAMVATWEAHLTAEFQAKSVEATMATMTPDPFVNHVPVMTGGVGYDEVYRFYSTHFLPADTAIVPISRTVGCSRLVDELIHSFTRYHRDALDAARHQAHGQARRDRSHRRRHLRRDKIAGERIYWDQASVLSQIGLVDPRDCRRPGSRRRGRSSIRRESRPTG